METKIEINPRGWEIDFQLFSFSFYFPHIISIIEYHIGVKIKANTVGFFIANDAEEVRRASVFCKVTKSSLIAIDKGYFAKKYMIFVR